MNISRLCCFPFATLLLTCLAQSAELKVADIAIAAKPGFTLEKTHIGAAKIPAIVLTKENVESKRPSVILIHGGSVCDPVATKGLPYKEEWFRPVYEDVPYRLAQKGILVVAIDAAWAETRISPDAQERVNRSPVEAVFTYYFAAVGDISQTIDYLRTRPDVDTNRIGLAGKSGGAITSLIAACQEPRLAVVVSWKGGADFIDMGRRRGQQADFDKAFRLAPDFRRRLEHFDPINAYKGIPPKAIALINNRTDPLIPRENAEALYGKVRPLYRAYPDKLLLKLIETKKPTHDDQVEAFDAGCDWLEKHLL